MEILKMLGQILLLVLGFVFMIKGADVFVDGASKIADHQREEWQQRE